MLKQYPPALDNVAVKPFELLHQPFK